MRAAILLAILGGCQGGGDRPAGTWGEVWDASEDFDGDGVSAETDCNDFDVSVHPDAPEVCGNGEDDDCNGAADCDDDACAIDPSCDAEVTWVEHCFDGVDNDDDGLADCDDPDCDFDHACTACDVQVTGTCGTTWRVFTTWPHASVSDYACDPGAGSGPDIVYEFLVLDDTHVTARVDPDGGSWGVSGDDVDLYVLEGACHPEACVDFSASSGVGGFESVSWDAQAVVWYFIVLERVSGSETQFELELFCD